MSAFDTGSTTGPLSLSTKSPISSASVLVLLQKEAWQCYHRHDFHFLNLPSQSLQYHFANIIFSQFARSITPQTTFVTLIMDQHLEINNPIKSNATVRAQMNEISEEINNLNGYSIKIVIVTKNVMKKT